MSASSAVSSAGMKPLVLRRERIVTVPVDVLWQLIEPATSLPSWLPLASRCDLLSGKGLGRRQRMITKWGRRTAEIDQEVIVYQPNKRLEWKHVDERMGGKPAPRMSSHVTFAIELESIGPGTRVQLESTNVPANAFSAMLLKFIAARRIGKALDRALDVLSAVGG